MSAGLILCDMIRPKQLGMKNFRALCRYCGLKWRIYNHCFHNPSSYHPSHAFPSTSRLLYSSLVADENELWPGHIMKQQSLLSRRPFQRETWPSLWKYLLASWHQDTLILQVCSQYIKAKILIILPTVCLSLAFLKLKCLSCWQWDSLNNKISKPITESKSILFKAVFQVACFQIHSWYGIKFDDTWKSSKMFCKNIQKSWALFSKHAVKNVCDPMDCDPPGSSVHGTL